MGMSSKSLTHSSPLSARISAAATVNLPNSSSARSFRQIWPSVTRSERRPAKKRYQLPF
jgi:hypothetical protein